MQREKARAEEIIQLIILIIFIIISKKYADSHGSNAPFVYRFYAFDISTLASTRECKKLYTNKRSEKKNAITCNK